MNQDFHILCSMLGAYKKNNSKEKTEEYIRENAAAIEIVDSFRCRLDRQITHCTSGSYWEMPETLEELRLSKPEQMRYHFSEKSKSLQGLCVNELIDFKTLVRNNLSLFSEQNVDGYGTPVLMHALQDFYTDVVWRLMYNFEGQDTKILKTQKAVGQVDEDITQSGKDRTKKAKYSKLGPTLKEADKKFREEYKTINDYASYRLAMELQGLGFDIYTDEQNDIFSRLEPEVASRYPTDVFEKSGKYMTFSPRTKQALQDPKEAERLESEIEQIFGGNLDLFVKAMRNSRDASIEAERIAAQIAEYSKNGVISEEDLDKIFEKQIRISQKVNEYQRSVYQDYERQTALDAK